MSDEERELGGETEDPGLTLRWLQSRSRCLHLEHFCLDLRLRLVRALTSATVASCSRYALSCSEVSVSCLLGPLVFVAASV